MNKHVEVITGPERRRRWSHEEKLRLVAEACRPGNSVSQIARERGISGKDGGYGGHGQVAQLWERLAQAVFGK